MLPLLQKKIIRTGHELWKNDFLDTNLMDYYRCNVFPEILFNFQKLRDFFKNACLFVKNTAVKTEPPAE